VADGNGEQLGPGPVREPVDDIDPALLLETGRASVAQDMLERFSQVLERVGEVAEATLEVGRAGQATAELLRVESRERREQVAELRRTSRRMGQATMAGLLVAIMLAPIAVAVLTTLRTLRDATGPEAQQRSARVVKLLNDEQDCDFREALKGLPVNPAPCVGRHADEYASSAQLVRTPQIVARYEAPWWLFAVTGVVFFVAGISATTWWIYRRHRGD
jgi:hypothetical protein